MLKSIVNYAQKDQPLTYPHLAQAPNHNIWLKTSQSVGTLVSVGEDTAYTLGAHVTNLDRLPAFHGTITMKNDK